MDKIITFSFGDGLKGNVPNKFDFETKFEIFTLSGVLLHTQTSPVINLNDISITESKIKIKVTQYKQNYSKSNEFEIDITKPIESTIVESIIVDPNNIHMQQGDIQLFTATITGTNNPPQTVTWTISGQISSSTNITSGGTLTIGIDETSTSIIVKAISTFDTTKFSTASVIITSSVTSTDYLKMFTAINTDDPNYIDLNRIKLDYPKYDKYFYRVSDKSDYYITLNTVPLLPLKQSFYEGRNQLSPCFDDPSITTIIGDVYYAKLFKLSQDCRNNNLILPEIDNYNNAMTYMTNIGINNIIQRHEIFLTYHTGTPNIIKSSWGIEYQTMTGISDYYPKEMNFVFDWLSWASTKAGSNDIAGYASGPGLWPADGSFIGHINCEKYNGGNILESDHGGLSVKPKQWRHKSASGDWTPWNSNYSIWSSEKETPDIVANGGFAITNVDIDINLQKALSTAQLVIHETGHAVCAYKNVMNSTVLRAGYSSEWLSIGGWTQSASWYNDNYGKPAAYKLATKFITEWTASYEPSPTPYGCTHPLDDFAESYSMYILIPDFLKQYYPKRYNFIKNYISTIQKQNY